MDPSTKVEIFISCVSDEFGRWREEVFLHAFTGMEWCAPVAQEYFVNEPAPLLAKLNRMIKGCHAMVHLIGQCTGAVPAGRAAIDAAQFMQDHPGIVAFLLPHFDHDQTALAQMSYTQWEAWLALYHGLDLRVFTTKESILDWQSSGRDPYIPTLAELESQRQHTRRLRKIGHYATEFADIIELGMKMLREVGGQGGILRLVLEDIRKKLGWSPECVAELRYLLLIEGAKILGPSFIVPAAVSILRDIDQDVPDTTTAELHLISELVKSPDWQDLATLALLAERRAAACGQPALQAALTIWLDAALKEQAWSRRQLEGHAIAKLQDLPHDGLPPIVLEVSWEPDENAGSDLVSPLAYLRVGSLPCTVNIGPGPVTKRNVITSAANQLGKHRCASACAPQRVELFVAPEDKASFVIPWEQRGTRPRPDGALSLHHWPVVLRLRRDAADWRDLAVPLDPIDHTRLPHWSGQGTSIEPEACRCGMFFCSNYATSEPPHQAIARLADWSGLGLWSRQGLSDTEAQSALQELHATPLAELPARLHSYKLAHHASAPTHWPHLSLLYDHPKLTADATLRFTRPESAPTPTACSPVQVQHQIF